MKKLQSKLWAKCVAFFLLLVVSVGTVICGTGIIFLDSYDCYKDATGTLAQQQILQSMTKQNENTLVFSYYDAWRNGEDVSYYEQYFSKSNNNFFFKLYDKNGKEVLSNYWTDQSLQDIEDTSTYLYATQVEQSFPGQMFTCGEADYNSDEAIYEYRDETGTVVYKYDDYGSLFDMQNDTWGSWSYANGQTTISYERTVKENLLIEGGVNAELSAPDGYAWRLQLLHEILDLRYVLLAVAAAGILAIVLLVLFLLWSAGHKEGETGIQRSGLSRVPLDLQLGIIVLLSIGACVLIQNLYHGVTGLFVGLILLAGVIIESACMGFLHSFAVCIKCGRWWRNTVIFLVLRWLYRGIKKLIDVLPLVWQVLLICAGIILLEGLTMAMFYWQGAILVLVWLLEKGILVSLIILVCTQMRKLEKAGQTLASGNLSAQTDTSNMLPALRRHGENLNRIGQGMNAAVEDRMRSERLKTELITNVSHDLKTPLTSIVNYVDLMGQLQELSPAEAGEYLEVLKRQSAKLKKLTEDLVDASKASSGTMPVNLAPVNLVELLQQAVGEYEEKLTAGKLQLCVELPQQCTIRADGRLLWRILDNLLGNCCKYAMPGTRVYLTLTKGESRAAIFLKNISREPLNIDANALMERFVRGDASRSSDGSGLGLSIARSLSQLQQGTFAIGVDGDLFKAELTFPLDLPASQ